MSLIYTFAKTIVQLYAKTRHLLYKRLEKNKLQEKHKIAYQVQEIKRAQILLAQVNHLAGIHANFVIR